MTIGGDEQVAGPHAGRRSRAPASRNDPPCGASSPVSATLAFEATSAPAKARRITKIWGAGGVHLRPLRVGGEVVDARWQDLHRATQGPVLRRRLRRPRPPHRARDGGGGILSATTATKPSRSSPASTETARAAPAPAEPRSGALSRGRCTTSPGSPSSSTSRPAPAGGESTSTTTRPPGALLLSGKSSVRGTIWRWSACGVG